MANPQVEEGHIDLANEIVEALAKTRLSGEEVQCLWVILRKTYGWHKKEDRISLSQFSKMTGIKRQNVFRALKKLSSKKIIAIINNDDSTQVNSYKMIKDFDTWIPVIKKDYCNQKRLHTVIKNDDQVSSNLINTKENTKETIQKKGHAHSFAHSFELFWKAYPKKINKGRAEKAWKSLKIDKELINQILLSIEQHKRTFNWEKDGGQFIPHPATFLNARGWEDEIEVHEDGYEDVPVIGKE
jgi:phage replication O-like protein O